MVQVEFRAPEAQQSKALEQDERTFWLASHNAVALRKKQLGVAADKAFTGWM